MNLVSWQGWPKTAGGLLCKPPVVIAALAAVVICGPSIAAEAPAQGATLLLTAEKVIHLTLRANRNVKTSEVNLANARFAVESAWRDFDTYYYPSASAGVSGGAPGTDTLYGAGLSLDRRFTFGSRLTASPVVEWTGQGERTRIDIAFEQPLFRGAGVGYNMDNVLSARYAEKNAEMSNAITRRNAVLFAITAFYQVVRHEELLKINADLERMLLGHVMAAQAKEKAGYATPIDVYRAKIQLKNAQQDVAASRAAVENSKRDLKSLLALPQDTEIETRAGLDIEKSEVDEYQALATALENRIEITQASLSAGEAARRTGVAKHELAPELNLSVRYSRAESPEAGDEAGPVDEAWAAFLVTRSDLSRKRERIRYQRSLLDAQNAAISLDAARDNVARQALVSHRNLANAWEQVILTEEQIWQAQGKLALAQIKFNHGLAGNFDLIEAQMEIQRAQAGRLASITGYILGGYQLKAAMGVLLPEESLN